MFAKYELLFVDQTKTAIKVSDNYCFCVSRLTQRKPPKRQAGIVERVEGSIACRHDWTMVDIPKAYSGEDRDWHCLQEPVDGKTYYVLELLFRVAQGIRDVMIRAERKRVVLKLQFRAQLRGEFPYLPNTVLRNVVKIVPLLHFASKYDLLESQHALWKSVHDLHLEVPNLRFNIEQVRELDLKDNLLNCGVCVYFVAVHCFTPPLTCTISSSSNHTCNRQKTIESWHILQHR